VEVGSESTGRRHNRAVSFDSSVSSEIEDDDEHEQLYSPRFNPPLSPPPHHLHHQEEEEEEEELISNGHSASISPLESTRTIVIRTPELWRESPPQPLTDLERYQTQVRLRAQVERELLRRGNHVAFEREPSLSIGETHGGGIEMGIGGVGGGDMPYTDAPSDNDVDQGFYT
jgi:hypothetical protein